MLTVMKFSTGSHSRGIILTEGLNKIPLNLNLQKHSVKDKSSIKVRNLPGVNRNKRNYC